MLLADFCGAGLLYLLHDLIHLWNATSPLLTVSACIIIPALAWHMKCSAMLLDLTLISEDGSFTVNFKGRLHIDGGLLSVLTPPPNTAHSVLICR
jgi:hypothetical protein